MPAQQMPECRHVSLCVTVSAGGGERVTSERQPRDSSAGTTANLIENNNRICVSHAVGNLQVNSYQTVLARCGFLSEYTSLQDKKLSTHSAHMSRHSTEGAN